CTNGTTWGHIWLYDYSYAYSPNGSNAITLTQQGNVDAGTQLLQYDYDGSLAALGLPQWAAPLDPSQIGLPRGFFPVGTNRDNYAVQQSYHIGERRDTFVPESTNFTVYSDAAYELTDNIEAYGDFLMSRRKTSQTASTQFFNFGGTFNSPNLPTAFEIPNDPVVIPLITGDALISPTTYSDHAGQRTQVNYYRAIGGLRGELKKDGLFSDWRWDVYAQHSTSRGEYRSDIISGVVVSEIGDFRSSSCAGDTIENFAGVMTECVDIDYNDPAILAGHLTQAQRALLYGVDVGHTKYNQTYLEAIVDGNVITLPAGDVGVALGATWRKDSITDTPGDNALGGFIFLENPAGITTGSSRTIEAFGEINIPVLRDVPLFESLDVNGSLRWTDVNTVAKPDLTWKAGVDWRMTEWLRLRGTWGTSFRAPALFELYLQNESFIVRQNGVDPCIDWAAALADGGISQRIADNCAADGIPDDFTGGGVEPTVTLGGGLGTLEPETSTSKSVSAIITTPNGFLGDGVNLSLAVDWFNIKVSGTVDTLSANQIVFGCYRSESFPTDPLCDLFVRGQTGAPYNIDQISATFININRLENTGIDLTMQYTHESLIDGWDLDVRSSWVRQLKDDEELFDGIIETVNGEAGDPKWVGEVNFIVSKNDWTAFWGLNVVGPTSDEQDFLDDNGDLCLTSATVGDYCVDLVAEATVYHNTSLTMDHDSWSFTLGMSNVFDTRPPRVTTDGFNGAEISTIGQ
ncbi:MAG: TonB-dependent receptor, partial [Oricola sp.]|nr:TonB-dependent receptor [Oricola sp.]